MVMAGQDEGGVRTVSTGAGADIVPDLEHKPWLFDINGPIVSDSEKCVRTTQGPRSAATASRYRQDARTATAPEIWGKSGTGLGGTGVKPDSGDSSGFWQWDNVGAASVARVSFECAEVRTGLNVQSGTRVVLVCGSGTGVSFEGTSSGAWERFEVMGSERREGFVGTASGDWI